MIAESLSWDVQLAVGEVAGKMTAILNRRAWHSAGHGAVKGQHRFRVRRSYVVDLGRVPVAVRYLSAHVALLAVSWSVKVSVSAAGSVTTLARPAGSR